jgi:hypothetical protein
VFKKLNRCIRITRTFSGERLDRLSVIIHRAEEKVRLAGAKDGGIVEFRLQFPFFTGFSMLHLTAI